MTFMVGQPRYERLLSAAGVIVALCLVLAVLVGMPRWMLLFAGAALAAVLYGWSRTREGLVGAWRPDRPPEPAAPPVEPIERSGRFDDRVPSAERGFPFTLSYTARWLTNPDLRADVGESVVRDLVGRRACAVTTRVTVGDSELAADLLLAALCDGSLTDAADRGVEAVTVRDVKVRVDRDTDERWRALAAWRREVELAKARRDHLDQLVRTSPREMLLWHLAQQPDLKKAADMIEPVSRLLNVLVDPVGPADPAEATSHGSTDRPAVSPPVRLVEQEFPDGDGQRGLFALRFARFLDQNGMPAMAKEVRDRFVPLTDEGPG